MSEKYMDIKTTKRSVGRPKMKPSDRRSYQRIAILDTTYKRAAKNAKKEGLKLLDYIDSIIK